MKNIRFLLIGILFGLALTKGEAISWYRMAEMFRFESFHMFGIFMTAVPVGALSLIVLRALKVKTIDGELIEKPVKKYNHGVVFGGLIFGFGWALVGACPGPLYALLGGGYTVIIAAFLAALAGTWTYGYLQPRLPH